MSFVDAIRSSSRIGTASRDVLYVVGASLLFALLSQVELRLWFTPVPLTLQTFGVMLIAATLGSKRGALALLAYLGEGALGFPVFAGGMGGVAVFAGPTTGYLCGFVVAAFFMGLLLERGWNKNFFKSLAAMGLGSFLILSLGALWLSYLVGFHHALLIGLYPFLVGSALKSVAAALAISPSRFHV